MKTLFLIAIFIIFGYYVYNEYWNIEVEEPVVQKVQQVEPPPPPVVSRNVRNENFTIQRHLNNGDWGSALIAFKRVNQQNLNQKERELINKTRHQISQEITRDIDEKIQVLQRNRQNVRNNRNRCASRRQQEIDNRINRLRAEARSALERLR